MDKSAATARIARELNEAESAFDSTMLHLTTLMATLIRARQAAGVGPSTGQAAIMNLVRSQQTLLESQNSLGRTHRELRSVAIEVHGMVDEDYCPPNKLAPVDLLAPEESSQAA